MPKATILRRAVFACICSLPWTYVHAEPKSVDVPPGDLATALELFTKQTGIELVFFTDQISGLRTRGFKGTVPPEEAAAKLIEGTSLQLSRDPSGAMLITAPAANSDAVFPPVEFTVEPDRATVLTPPSGTFEFRWPGNEYWRLTRGEESVAVHNGSATRVVAPGR